MMNAVNRIGDCLNLKTETCKKDLDIIKNHLDDLAYSEYANNDMSNDNHQTQNIDGYHSWQVDNFHSLPTWLQDNEYLLFYHRPQIPSLKACFLSMFRLHTETGNIWTHLLGFVFFLGLAVYSWRNPPAEIPSDVQMVITFFLVCTVFCLGVSFVFHTLSCYSETITRFLCKLDYCGIAVLIMGSSLAWMYHSFHGDPKSLMWYTALLLSLGFAVVLCSLWDKFAEPELRAVRAAVFIAFGISGAIPAIHYMAEKGLEHAMQHASFGLLSLSGALYLFGGLVYALRVPERFMPGLCDIFPHSHQILHVMVIGGAVVFYCAIYNMASTAHSGDVT